MRVTVVLEVRYDRLPDGSVWTTGGSHRFFLRYLDVFDGVKVVARMRDVSEPAPGSSQASGPGVTFAAVPYFVGPWQYVRAAWRVRQAVRAAISPLDAVILRLGSLIAVQANPTLTKRGQPYGVEVVGDPYSVFAPGVIRHPLRPLLRWWFSDRTRVQCARAAAAAYVTKEYLQARYPCGAYSVGISDADLRSGARLHSALPFATHFSSASLDDVDFRHALSPCAHSGVWNILTVGSLAQMYKGVDILLRAIRICSENRMSVNLTVVGDGRFRTQLEAEAARLGLSERALFLGALPPGPTLTAELDRADLFVLASRTEGLPRAMLEAMARGLPCVGTAVGGIPELLAETELVPPGDPTALAERISAILRDPSRRAQLSARNIAKAEEYREDALRPRRTAFYRYIRDITQAWLDESGH